MGIESPAVQEAEVAAKNKKMFELTIDDKKIMAEEGSSLFDAVKRVGIELPAMCYHYAFSPFGSCGICLVEVAGKNNNVRSCTAKVNGPMVVRTDTEKMVDARKKAVEKHLTTHPLDCPVCDADGKCELQDMAYDLDVYDIKKAVRKNIPEDTRSVVLDFNMERCILCGQCINVCKEVQLIDALCFYKKDGKTHVGAHGGEALYCEFCGDCLAVCPVGAIVSRFSKYTFKPWQLKKTETTCTYCADGCTLTLESEGQKVMRVTSKLSYLSKFGHGVEDGDGHGGLCVRGRFGFQFIQSERRLSRPSTKPTTQTDASWRPIPWFTAVAEVGKRLAEVRTQYGGGAIAGLISGRCTNEEVYLFQKLMRAALGSNHIDTAARYGHMNSVLAMRRAFGVGRTTTSFKAMALADVILLVGSNLSETHPVSSLRVKAAMSQWGAKVIVADVVQTNMMKLATHPLKVAVGGLSALVMGLTKAVIEQGLTYPSFMEEAPYEAIKSSVAHLSEATIAEQSGLAWEKIVEIAALLARSKRGTLLWGEGVIQDIGGYEQVLRLIDLARVTGIDRKTGGGLLPICEENNEQGAVDMGGVSEFLPGQVPYDDPVARHHFESAWAADLPGGIGSSLFEIIERARRGEIKALYVVGEDPVGTLPEATRVREALSRIPLIICQDPFLTETGKMAHYLLPAATFAEKDGTFTGMEGVSHRVVQAFDPRGEARPDWKIFCDLSKYIGYPLAYRSAGEITSEIARLVPSFSEAGAPGGSPSQCPGSIADRYRINRHDRDDAYPYTLTLVQSIYHSGKLSTRDEGLMKIDAKRALCIGTEDAERLGVKSGDSVNVRSLYGAVNLPVEVVATLPTGFLQFPEHFPEVGDLFAVVIDPVTHVLYHKSVSVSLKKALDYRLLTVS